MPRDRSRVVARVSGAVLLASLLGAAGAAPIERPASGPASHGFHSCGENVALVFMNPDLRVHPDGFVHASGRFFSQFQAIGERATDIEKFVFSVGKPVPEALHSCAGPAWATGAYFAQWTDDDPREGFWVAVDSTLVPDGEYAAAVSGFDAAGVELVRFYVNAKVENGCVAPCSQTDAETIRANDRVAPWPRILPGDGEQTNDVGGLTIEIAEEVGVDAAGEPEVRAYVNGARVALTRWEGEPMGPLDEADDKRPWGGWRAHVVVRSEDVIRVVARDANGNQAEKILHLGDPTIGGRISLARVSIAVEGDGARVVAENGTARARLVFRNTGEGTAHGNLVALAPAGARAFFDEDHVTIPAGRAHEANLTIVALADLPPGEHAIEGYATYRDGTEQKQQPFRVRFLLPEASNLTARDEDRARADATGAQDAPRATGDVESDSRAATRFLPSPGPVSLALALGASLVAFTPLADRRRRLD